MDYLQTLNFVQSLPLIGIAACLLTIVLLFACDIVDANRGTI